MKKLFNHARRPNQSQIKKMIEKAKQVEIKQEELLENMQTNPSLIFKS